MSNVAALFRRVAGAVGDRPAIIPPDGPPVTFHALSERVDRLSAGVTREGLRPGDRSIVMIPMSADLYTVLLGLLKSGGVAVFVDPWVGVARIASFAAFAEPSGYFGVPRAHLLRWRRPELRRVPLSVTTGARVLHCPARRSLAELEREPGNHEVHDAKPADPALVTFTTGSSGTPKGADRTHGFLAAQHHALRTEFPPEEGDVDLTMFPVFALNNLALGVPTVIPRVDFRRVDRVDGGAVVEQMRRHAVTTCTASPPFLDRVAEYVRRHPVQRPKLRRILGGGAPVSDAQLRAWRAAFPGTRISVVYGSTEAEPVAHVDAEERLDLTARRRHAGYCVGRPSRLVRTRVIRVERGPVSASDRAVDQPPGAVGELLVTGDHVCRSYFRNDAAVRENKLVEADGTVWHRMGDTGSFDEDGRFWLVGRVHSTIRRAGGLVHPQIVEQIAADDDPRVRRAAALGRPDHSDNQRLVLVLETTGPGVDANALRRDTRTRLAAAGVPPDEVVVTLRPLPVDPRHASKIDYDALHRLLDEGALR